MDRPCRCLQGWCYNRTAVQRSKGYTPVRRGRDGLLAPAHKIRRHRRLVPAWMADLKRCRLAIVVAVVGGLISRPVRQMTTICQKSRTSLGAHEQGSSKNGGDAPNQYVGLSSEFCDLLRGLEASSGRA